MALNGSCHCGGVTYAVVAIDGDLWNCYCDTCRKTHAADHNTAARVLRDDFRLLSGKELLTGYESSPGKLRHFCSKCGTHVFAEKEGMPFVVIRSGTLDNDPGVVPQSEVWVSQAKTWLRSRPDAKSFAEAPG